MIKQILYAFSFFQLLFIRLGLTQFVPCTEIGVAARVRYDLPPRNFNRYFVGYLYQPPDHKDLRLLSPCLLIQYDENKCDGITIEGSLAYNDMEPHTIDVISKEKSEMNGIGKGWRTKLEVQRMKVTDRNYNETHIYKMTLKDITEFKIVWGAKQEDTPVAKTWEWFPEIVTRFTGYYAILSLQETNNVAIITTCKTSEDDETEYSRNGGWIMMIPPVSENEENIAKIEEEKNKYGRCNSFSKLRSYYNPDS